MLHMVATVFDWIFISIPILQRLLGQIDWIRKILTTALLGIVAMSIGRRSLTAARRANCLHTYGSSKAALVETKSSIRPSRTFSGRLSTKTALGTAVVK